MLIGKGFSLSMDIEITIQNVYIVVFLFMHNSLV